jgi:hypothetical protein
MGRLHWLLAQQIGAFLPDLKSALDHAQVNEQRWSLPHNAAQPTITSDRWTPKPKIGRRQQIEAMGQTVKE